MKNQNYVQPTRKRKDGIKTQDSTKGINVMAIWALSAQHLPTADP